MSVNLTLLDIVQDILNVIDGDVVNSIFDTEESEQVARIVVSTYKDLVSNRNWPNTRKALTLVARSDSNFPTHIRLNDDVKELVMINYDKRKYGETRKVYSEVKWKEPDDFLRHINSRDNTSSTVQTVIDDSGIELLIANNAAPSYFTSFNDKDIIFDSFDNSVDTTIQESKVQAYGYILPTLALEDDAVPELPPDGFSAFINEAKAAANYVVRQTNDTMSTQKAERQQRWLSRKAWRVNGGIKYRNYGRRSPKGQE